MLNNKKNNFIEINACSKKKKLSFLQYPKFSKNNFVQTGSAARGQAASTPSFGQPALMYS